MGLLDRITKRKEEKDLVALSEAILLDTTTDIETLNTISVPIGEMATLGGAVASLIPSLRTVMQTTSINTEGLYRLANASVGDTLKMAKNNNYWAAFKTTNGKSKLAQLADAGPLSATSQTIMPIDPAIMMMAVALYSIEKQLGKIEEMEKQIISFLQEEKESKIEGDLKTLINVLQEYKYNWEDEKYKTNHHKLALDIKRSMEQNIIFYQKQISDEVGKGHTIVGKSTVDSINQNLQKKFKYYRLSLYIYSLASFLELMLLGNFQEEYITQVKNKIVKYSMEYRETFETSSSYLETILKKAVGKNALLGIGKVENALGSFIGSVPYVKEGKLDEWLIKAGAQHKDVADNIEKSSMEKLAGVSSPGTEVFIEKLDDMSKIYNRTEQIFFDDKNIYLVAG